MVKKIRHKLYVIYPDVWDRINEITKQMTRIINDLAGPDEKEGKVINMKNKASK
jgi:hypothetical protein